MRDESLSEYPRKFDFAPGGRTARANFSFASRMSPTLLPT
jgi:hypothetical protein